MNRKGESITSECLGRGWERSRLLFQHQLALQPLIDVPYTTAASGPGGRKPLAHPSWSKASSQMFPAFGELRWGQGRPTVRQRAAAQMLGFSVFSATGLREPWFCGWCWSVAVSSWAGSLYLPCPGQGTQLPRKKLSAPEGI